MVGQDIKNFIFFSSAAVYGNPEKTLILESEPIKPINFMIGKPLV
jgi:UDP-glucose 4-epimerase